MAGGREAKSTPTVGLLITAGVLSHLTGADFELMGGAFYVAAGLLVLLELRPLVTAGSPDANGVSTSTAFVFALLLHWGLGPALLMMTIATILADVASVEAMANRLQRCAVRAVLLLCLENPGRVGVAPVEPGFARFEPSRRSLPSWLHPVRLLLTFPPSREPAHPLAVRPHEIDLLIEPASRSRENASRSGSVGDHRTPVT